MAGFSDIRDKVQLNNTVLKRQVTLYQTSLFYLILSVQSLPYIDDSRLRSSIPTLITLKQGISYSETRVIRHSCVPYKLAFEFVCAYVSSRILGAPFVHRFVAIYFVNKYRKLSIFLKSFDVTVFLDISAPKSILFIYFCCNEFFFEQVFNDNVYCGSF